MSPTAVVRAVDLTKFYGMRRGVEGVSFSVEPGEVTGFLGPNGSGKTTVIRMLVGLLKITSGHAELLGHSVAKSPPEIRAQVGYLPGTLGLYEHLTAQQFFDHLCGLRRIHVDAALTNLCNRFSLNPNLHIKTMSKGTKQKVGLIQAFMHSPSVLILDEPTSGLDPLVQHEFENLLRETQQRGAAVILSSHVLSDVEKLADRVVILNEGRLIANQKFDQLPGHDTHNVKLEFDRAIQAQDFANIEGFRLLSVGDKSVSGTTTGSQRPLLEVALRCGITRIQSPEPSLDELFRFLVLENTSNNSQQK